MRPIALGLLAATALSVGAAQAASPTYNWNGLYLGAHAGYGWGTSGTVATSTNSQFTTGTDLGIADLTGGLGGLHGGFNLQLGQWVFGIESDYSWSALSGTDTMVSPSTGESVAATLKTKWLADVTGRVGYAWINWLLYAKGGGVWTHADQNIVPTTPAGVITTTSSGSESRSGWLIGAGLEWGLAAHWVAKIEYNYLDFGTISVIRTNDATGKANTRDQSLNVNVVKVGMSYLFDLSGR